MEANLKTLKDLIEENGADMDAFVFCASYENSDLMPMMIYGSSKNVLTMLAQTLAEAIKLAPKDHRGEYAQTVCDYLNRSLDESEEKKVN